MGKHLLVVIAALYAGGCNNGATIGAKNLGPGVSRVFQSIPSYSAQGPVVVDPRITHF